MVKSCGCLRAEKSAINASKNHKHKESRTRLYHTWQGMKGRCSRKNQLDYGRYGGRGIAVCEEWLHDYEVFRKWAMENGYADHLTIERTNNHKGYSPDNCIWADMKTQSRNRRSNVKIEYDGEMITLTELAEIFGLEPKVVMARHKRGDTTLERLTRSSGDKIGLRKGESSHMSKLREEDIREIRRLHESGINQSQIARQYGLHSRTVCSIVNRQTWKHVV